MVADNVMGESAEKLPEVDGRCRCRGKFMTGVLSPECVNKPIPGVVVFGVCTNDPDNGVVVGIFPRVACNAARAIACAFNVSRLLAACSPERVSMKVFDCCFFFFFNAAISTARADRMPNISWNHANLERINRQTTNQLKKRAKRTRKPARRI